jgi:DNA topoisomerase-1
MKLVVVESPTKARTLSRFLNKDYQVMASMGHVYDLPKKRLSVDIVHDFQPQYEVVPAKVEVLERLRQATKQAKLVILATDPDREGEAIAYHLAFLLSSSKKTLLPPSATTVQKALVDSEKDKGAPTKKGDQVGQIDQDKFVRITFHEITEAAIKEALKNPGQLNLPLVEAQQARRVLDRLVGYKLSPLLWRKVRRGLSAGRVQSVALRLIVEREREIKKFEKKEYWTIECKIKNQKSKIKNSEGFLANLLSKNGEKYEKNTTVKLFAGDYTYVESRINNQQLCDEIVKDLKKQKFVVENVEERETTRTPPPPFTTSTLQQAANRTFGFSAKKTMSLAQRLYEEGYITYHRTDSFNLAETAVKNIRAYLLQEFGEKYLSAEPRVYKTRSRLAQEAHEAIRPTKINSKFKMQNSKFDAESQRLYELIWKRTVATQMAAARSLQTNVMIKAGPYLLKASGLRLLFEGYLRLYPELLREKGLPSLHAGDQLKLLAVLPKQNFTSPPPRYTEASLVKVLETKGIGRPSTYAPTISLIQNRGYVEKKEGVFWPTPVGEAVINFLTPHFPTLIDIPFTAEMEGDLDAIARGEKPWVEVLRQFYHSFEKKLNSVSKNSPRIKIEATETGEKCPKCNEGQIVIRTSRFGKFLSCSRFPQCDWKGDYQEKITGIKCPQCGSPVVVRRSRRGRQFYGCSRWPACQWASWYKPKENLSPK